MPTEVRLDDDAEPVNKVEPPDAVPLKDAEPPDAEPTSELETKPRSAARGTPSQITGGLLLLVIVCGLLVTRRLWNRAVDPQVAHKTSLALSRTGGSVDLGSATITPGYQVDINAATLSELLNLPTIGPTTAAKILAHREKVGKFQQLSDLQAVSGIGPQTLKQLGPYLLFPEPPATAANSSVAEATPSGNADTILTATKPE